MYKDIIILLIAIPAIVSFIILLWAGMFALIGIAIEEARDLVNKL